MRKFIIFSAFAFGLLIAFSACEKDDEDTGTVVVLNETGYTIITDVRWGDMSVNDERLVSDGDQTTYEDVPAGEIEIWGKVDQEGYVWASFDHTLEPGQNYNFTWNPPDN